MASRHKHPLEGEMLQGTLDMLILKTLTRGAMHGYAITEYIQETTDDVLKVEEPGRGDYQRSFPPMGKQDSGTFLLCNRNKRSLAMDLKTDEGKAVFRIRPPRYVNPELVDFVRQVQPKRVFTLHGFAADFANTLRHMGFDARALSEPDQLTFPI